MAVVSSGQITIVDNNDAKPITASITTNISTTQIYSKDESTVSYTPNYSTTNLVLTPRVYMAGAGAEGGSLDISAQLTGMKWSNSIGGASLAATLTHTISANQTPSAAPTTYYFEADYTDPLTGLVSKIVCSIQTQILATGTNAVYVNVSGNNVLVQSDTAVKNTVMLTADLMRAAGVDTSGVTYRWTEMPANKVISTSATAGNVGATASSKYGFRTTAQTSSGSGGGIGVGVPSSSLAYADVKSLFIHESAVNSIQGYKVECKDADAKVYEAYFTVYDKTDPYTVRMISTAGDKLQNGVGTTTVFPEVWNGASKVADTTGWTFTYYFNAANGVRAGFVDEARTGVPEGRAITAHTSGNGFVVTLGTAFTSLPVANDIIKLVRPNGTVAYYEVASATGSTVTTRLATTSTHLNTPYPAPANTTDFVGGKAFVCTGNGALAGCRTTSGGNTAQAGSITVTGYDIDAKGTIICEANRP